MITITIKIIDNKDKNELYFYDAFNESPITKYLPSYYGFLRNKEIGFLQMEYIIGRTPTLFDIKKIKCFQSHLMNIDLQFIKKKINPRIHPRIFHPKFMYPFSTSEIKNIISRITKSNIPSKQTEIRQVLEEIFLAPSIIHRLDLRNDFVLQYKDLGGPNMIIDKEQRLFVIDWNSYGLAIPGADLLNFIMKSTFDFLIVENELFLFLKQQDINNYHTVTACLTLIYLDKLLKTSQNNAILNNLERAILFLKSSPIFINQTS